MTGRSIKFVLATCLATVLLGCASMGDIRAHMAFVDTTLRQHPEITLHKQCYNGIELHWASRGSPQKAVVVWLHGTPGEWTEAGRLYVNEQLLSQTLLVSVDRPGWGESLPVNHPKSGSLSQLALFESQAASLVPFIRNLKAAYPHLPLYLAGHSWGASLAPYLAVEARESIDGLLLFAGAYDPGLARPRWYHRWANTRLLKLVLGDALEQANDEMLALPIGLRAMENQ